MKPDFKLNVLRWYLTVDSKNTPTGNLVETFRYIRASNEFDEGHDAVDYELDTRGDATAEGFKWKTRRQHNVLAACDLVRGIVRAIACDLFGHHYEDVGSYANPEGGAEHFECSRCGQGFHHIYY